MQPLCFKHGTPPKKKKKGFLHWETVVLELKVTNEGDLKRGNCHNSSNSYLLGCEIPVPNRTSS